MDQKIVEYITFKTIIFMGLQMKNFHGLKISGFGGQDTTLFKQ